MTKDEAFQQYEEALDKASKDFERTKAEAKATLNKNLKAIRAKLHKAETVS